MGKRSNYPIMMGLVFLVLAVSLAGADTIYTKDGKELKGIVVEDYRDRIVFSTVDGEVSIMKSDINELYYDGEEDNLIKLAEQALERGDHMKAFAYYDRAYKINPNSRKAKDGIVFLQGLLFRKEQSQKEAVVRRQEEFERHGKYVAPQKSDEAEVAKTIEKLRETIGISFEVKGDFPEVTNVRTGSPSYVAGIRRGDLLIAIWGKLTGYMSQQDLVDHLMEKTSLEVKCTIERTIDVAISGLRTPISTPNDLIGAVVGIGFDGLLITGVREGGGAASAGIEKDDLVMAINGESTRYMPLKKAVEMIRGSRESSVRLTIRREVTFWRD
ncbi:MAG: PDZ domain-containing protein [Candidatus Omnitrophota bacterium]